MLTADHAIHALSAEERAAYERDGFLIIREALRPEQVTRLRALMEAFRDELVASGWDPHYRRPFRPGSYFNGLGWLHRDPAFLDLMDQPPAFPKVAGLLGANIHLYSTHGIIKQPEAQTTPELALGFHRDSGIDADMGTEDCPPRLQMKIAYWLTDASQPGRGNQWVVPGSHRWPMARLKPYLACKDGSQPPPEDALCVHCAPGDALIFDRALFHAGGQNHGDEPSACLFYGYSFRWMTWIDERVITPAMVRHCDPIRRQLLGVRADQHGTYKPRPEDVPLKAWLDEHAAQPSDPADDEACSPAMPRKARP